MRRIVHLWWLHAGAARGGEQPSGQNYQSKHGFTGCKVTCEQHAIGDLSVTLFVCVVIFCLDKGSMGSFMSAGATTLLCPTFADPPYHQ